MRRLFLAFALCFLSLPAFAATVTHEAANGDTSASPNASSAFTPADGDLLVVLAATAATTSTLTSSEGLTFHAAATTTQGSGPASDLTVYISEQFATAVSQTVTLTEVGTYTGTVMFVASVSGMSLAGADALRQFAVQTDASPSTTPAVTFAGAVLTGNPTLLITYNNSNPAALTEPSGWTEGGDTGHASPAKGAAYSYRNSGFTGTTITLGGTTATTASTVAVELDTSAAGGVFTVNPTVTAQDTNDYTLSGTTDAAVTVYAVACAKDSTAPTIAQVSAADCTGDVNALAAVSESWNGADSFILGGALTLKIYDLYATDGTSLVTLADEQLDVAAGYERTILTAQDPTSVYDGTETASGDYCDTEAVTSPDAYVVTPEADGTISYAAGGDQSRQFILGNCHDLSESDIDSYQFVFNNQAPEPGGGSVFDDPFLFEIDVAITPIDLETPVPDPEGDTVTVTALEALATGLSISSNDLTGTPTVCGTTLADIQWEDEYEATYVEESEITIGARIPDTTGMTEAEAIAAIEALCQ